MTAWLMTALGLLVLILAGDSLVRGAVNLSLRLGVPALIVSLTVVAFGTSAPELLVSISAVRDNLPGLALGNIVGSNTANILLVLGIPAILATIHSKECNTRKSFLLMIGASVLFIALAFNGVLSTMEGLIMLAALVLVLLDQFRDVRAYQRACANGEIAGLEEADPDMPWWRVILYLVLGLVGLPLGANLLVENASIIARNFGVSDAAIGLTLVAVGTSLPELATTVMAALRRQADVALGNVIGSNMFNLLAVIGVATLIRPIDVAPQFLSFDLWIMLAASLLLIPFVFLHRNITRLWGIVLTGLYLIYLVVVLA